MTSTSQIISYKPYRGHLEPTTAVYKAEMTLHPHHLEIVSNYEFEPYKPEPDEIPYRKYALLMPKTTLAIELTEQWHEQDPEKKAYPLVKVVMNGTCADNIYLETEEEAADIYTKLKKWLLNE